MLIIRPSEGYRSWHVWMCMIGLQCGSHLLCTICFVSSRGMSAWRCTLYVSCFFGTFVFVFFCSLLIIFLSPFSGTHNTSSHVNISWHSTRRLILHGAVGDNKQSTLRSPHQRGSSSLSFTLASGRPPTSLSRQSCHLHSSLHDADRRSTSSSSSSCCSAASSNNPNTGTTGNTAQLTGL